MQIRTAQSYAEKISEWLSPYCSKMEIVGSIRRKVECVGDVDILVIPRIETDIDMFGEVVLVTNKLSEFLHKYIDRENPGNTSMKRPCIVSEGPTQILMHLPKCQLDIFLANETNWVTRLLARTGSKEHNQWLASRALDMGWHWEPQNGLRNPQQQLHPVTSETDIYAALGVKFIAPSNRNQTWLDTHFGL